MMSLPRRSLRWSAFCVALAIGVAPPVPAQDLDAEDQALLDAVDAVSQPAERRAALEALAEHDLDDILDRPNAKRPALLGKIAREHPDLAIRMEALELLTEVGDQIDVARAEKLGETPSRPPPGAQPSARRGRHLQLALELIADSLEQSKDPDVLRSALLLLRRIRLLPGGRARAQLPLDRLGALAANGPRSDVRVAALSLFFELAPEDQAGKLVQSLTQDSDSQVAAIASDLAELLE